MFKDSSEIIFWELNINDSHFIHQVAEDEVSQREEVESQNVKLAEIQILWLIKLEVILIVTEQEGGFYRKCAKQVTEDAHNGRGV